MKVRIKVPFTRCRALPSSLICLQVQVHDSDGGERSSNVVGERDIVYKPKKILALKDIDPEERMNMVKAFVNAANTYRDGTYGTYGAYGGAVPVLVPRSYDAPQSLGTIHWCTR